MLSLWGGFSEPGRKLLGSWPYLGPGRNLLNCAMSCAMSLPSGDGISDSSSGTVVELQITYQLLPLPPQPNTASTRRFTHHSCLRGPLVACSLFSVPPVGTVILRVTPPASFLAAKLPLVHCARLSHSEDEAGISASSVGTHPSLGLTCRELCRGSGTSHPPHQGAP